MAGTNNWANFVFNDGIPSYTFPTDEQVSTFDSVLESTCSRLGMRLYKRTRQVPRLFTGRKGSKVQVELYQNIHPPGFTE